MSVLFRGQSSGGDRARKATLTVGGQITYFLWLKPHVIAGLDPREVLVHGTSNASYKNWRSSVYISAGSGLLKFEVPAVNTDGLWASNGALSLDVWLSFAVTYDYATPTTAPKFYKNGATNAAAGAGPSGAINADGQDFYLGNNVFLDRTFDGRIAHAAVWNRALSAAEVAGVHALGPLMGAPSGLVAYWRGTDSSAPGTDYSGNANTLTLTGAAYSSDESPAPNAAVAASDSAAADASQASGVGSAGTASEVAAPGVTQAGLAAVLAAAEFLSTPGDGVSTIGGALGAGVDSAAAGESAAASANVVAALAVACAALDGSVDTAGALAAALESCLAGAGQSSLLLHAPFRVHADVALRLGPPPFSLTMRGAVSDVALALESPVREVALAVTEE